jgi:ribosomal protein S18 acetylase RimI-like enzyme
MRQRPTVLRAWDARRDDLVIDVRVLDHAEVERVGTVLGLARLYQGDGFYLIAWRGDEPLGHLHLALSDPPELQDVEVASDHRRSGVARTLIAAAEREARARGFTSIRVGVGIGNGPAQALYQQCGYADVGLEPRHVKGRIEIRTGPIEVDDVVVTWQKDIAPATRDRRAD